MSQIKEPAKLPRIRVLVVDDDEASRELLCQELESDTFEVAVASSGMQALVVAAKWRPNVIVMDITMPVLDGITTCQELQTQPATRGVPVLFLTGHQVNDALTKRALAAGGCDFLIKPFDRRLLLARVSAYGVLDMLRNKQANVPAGG